MEPDRVFDFEPAQARALQWLPLAVRYKLDGSGLKIGLQQWQALSLQQRSALLRCPEGAGFDALVLQMVPGVRRLAGHAVRAFEDYVLAKNVQPPAAALAGVPARGEAG